MTRHTYRVAGAAVEVRDAAGEVTWRGRPDGYPASTVLAVPNSDDAIVLLDYVAGPKFFANMARLVPDGSIRWRAELPQASQPDAFTDAEFLDGMLVAHTWSGYRVRIDPETGDHLSLTFTK